MGFNYDSQETAEMMADGIGFRAKKEDEKLEFYRFAVAEKMSETGDLVSALELAIGKPKEDFTDDEICASLMTLPPGSPGFLDKLTLGAELNELSELSETLKQYTKEKQ
jgi:hypothetical protein